MQIENVWQVVGLLGGFLPFLVFGGIWAVKDMRRRAKLAEDWAHYRSVR
jgi:hypothetical protein